MLVIKKNPLELQKEHSLKKIAKGRHLYNSR